MISSFPHLLSTLPSFLKCMLSISLGQGKILELKMRCKIQVSVLAEVAVSESEGATGEEVFVVQCDRCNEGVVEKDGVGWA